MAGTYWMRVSAKEPGSQSRRALRATAQVMLLVVMVPLGIVSGWLVMAPTSEHLAARAAGGGDSAALLELVQRATQQNHAAGQLDTLLGHDEGALRALIDLSTGHEDAMLQLISVARRYPERMGQLSGVQMSYPFAVALLRHVTAVGMQTLQSQAATRADAAFVMGVACESGAQVPQSWSEAARWYAMAEKLGLGMARSYYAMAAYEAGVELHQQPGRQTEAAEWFRCAAERGHAAAQCALGVCFSGGIGVPCNLEQAVTWYKQAAAQNFDDAMFNLGWCHLHGEGVPQDVALAAEWFRKAAELGNDLAQYYMGRACELGQGMPLNPEQAVHWYRLAAEQGCTEARLALAACYEKGLGVAQDAAAARYWRQCAEPEFNQIITKSES